MESYSTNLYSGDIMPWSALIDDMTKWDANTKASDKTYYYPDLPDLQSTTELDRMGRLLPSH